jgi:hypothetical protein
MAQEFEPSYEAPPPLPTTPPPRRRRTGLIIGIIVALLLCCCCAALAGAWFYGDQLMLTLEEFSLQIQSIAYI